MKQVVFLDWYNTLSSSLYWGHLAATDPAQHLALGLALFETNAHLLVPWMLGQLTSEQVLDHVAATTGFSAKWVLREFVAGCERMTFVAPEVPSLVAQLRHTGVKVVIATDNMDAFSRWTVPALNLNTLFDGILNSCELGAMKNDLDRSGRSLFFDAYLTENDLRPSQCVLIDDSTDTAPAMQAIGLTYRQVTSRAHFIAELMALLQTT